MKYNLDRSGHSVYSLQYHLVIVVKYRRKALYSDVIRERLKEIIASLADGLDIGIIAQEPGDDHHHMLFKATPQANLSSIVNVIKGTSSRYLRQEFPETKDLLWGGSFWSASYFIASTGQVSLDMLKAYVESQGDKIADADQ